MNVQVPANNDLANRLYHSMSNFQGSDLNFNNLYDNDANFRSLIQSLQALVQKNNGGPFTGTVTPDNTPGRSGGGSAGGGAVGT